MVLPEKIGRYEIKSELGRGGMATVYRAYDPSFDREVAIKVLPREMLHDPQFRSRFEREIKMVAGLEHPSIVPVYDVGNEDGQPYFVMRYMTGGSLSDQIAKGNFSVEDTARVIEKIARGLAYAHKKGIVHRDLKPDNILFDNNEDPFISDFGVAKLTEASGGLTGSGVIGTPAYMSPEQAQGNEVDNRTDVYGLGVIVYQMLSGQQPYIADTPMGVVVKHITEPVPEILSILPSLSTDVDVIIKMALAKEKNQRYPTTIDLAKALNLAAFGNEGNLTFGTNSGLRSGIYKAPSGPARGKMGLVVAGIVLLVLVLGGFLLRNQLFAAGNGSSTEVNAATAVPILETVDPSTSSFAPACGPNVLPPLLDVKETNNTCTKKNPYVTIFVPDGATFEPLNADASCTSQITGDGKTILVCTGPGFLEYDLKVCVPPPPASGGDLNQCPANANFDPVNQCCAVPPPGAEPGCALFKVKLKGCG